MNNKDGERREVTAHPNSSKKQEHHKLFYLNEIFNMKKNGTRTSTM